MSVVSVIGECCVLSDGRVVSKAKAQEIADETILNTGKYYLPVVSAFQTLGQTLYASDIIASSGMPEKNVLSILKKMQKGGYLEQDPVAGTYTMTAENITFFITEILGNERAKLAGYTITK